MDRIVHLATKYMTVGVILIGITGIFIPSLFAPLAPKIPWMLGLIMFGMGMSLRPADFLLVWKQPRSILLGIFLQFLIMPSLAFLLISSFSLPPEIAIGVVLVGACPGGTASNVISYIANADVALSVSMTMVNTLLAPIATPFWIWYIAGTWVDISFTSMMMSITKMVLLPLIAGIGINYFFPRQVQRINKVMPLLSALVVILTVGCVVSLSGNIIITSGLTIFLIVILHNMFGLGLGYFFARLFGMTEGQKRAMAIEVGMQNSGLASTLALMYFTAAGGIAGALFSIWHNISGSLLASYFAGKDEKTEEAFTEKEIVSE